MLVYWLFRLTILVTRPLPLSLGYRIAAAVAEVCYHFFGRQRRALNENLSWVIQSNDPRAADAVARRAFRNFGRFVIDFIHFPAITREEIHARLDFDQWHELDEAMAAKRGVIIVTMHLGIWDLGAAALASRDYAINAVADGFAFDRMNELVHGSRERLGMKIIRLEHAAMGVFRCLKRGEMLAVLIDVPAKDQTVVVDFLGAPAEVSSAPARIALRTGAWVVPAVVLRGHDRDTTIRPVVDIRSIAYEPTGDEEHDVIELTRQILAVLERFVRQHPEQWFIFRRMWPDMKPLAERAALVAGEDRGAD